jgi:hypothetical protein
MANDLRFVTRFLPFTPSTGDSLQTLQLTGTNLIRLSREGRFWMIRRVVRDGWEYDKALEEANRIGMNNNARMIEFAREYIEKKKKK